MLDIKYIRQNPDIVREAILNKKSEVDLDQLLALDNSKRSLLTTLEQLNQSKNDIAKQISQSIGNQELIDQGKQIKLQLDEVDQRYRDIENQFDALLLKIPNIPTADTPIGPDESGNKVLRQVGDKPIFDFKPKEHWELGKDLDIIDNERAGQISGSRFAYIKGQLALLEFALVNYAFSILTNQEILEKIIRQNDLQVSAKPFIPVVPPVFIKPEIFQKMARLEPVDDRYHIITDDLYLIGSAEHTLGPLHMDETLKADALPVRYVGFSTAFRREAGAAGKDTRGILRLHQFDKVEIESFSMPEDGIAEQDFFVAIQEYLMQSLGLAYQIVITCTGDMGDPDARHLDLETWMPGQENYRETHSADYMSDYQARRLNTKVKTSSGKNEFVHMNDATVFAIGRTLIAIMENYQTKDGTIKIPEVLWPYMLGSKEIR